MKPSVLERILVNTRPNRKMASDGDFTYPVSIQHPVVEGDGPWMGTLSNGRFVRTRPGKNTPEHVMTAFVKCPIASEDELVDELYRALWSQAEKDGWDTRSSNLEEGVAKLRSKGLEPKSVVVPFTSIEDITGKELTEEDAAKLSLAQGHIAEVFGVKVLSARNALPKGAAIIASTPALTGFYMRIFDHVTVLFNRADSVVLVG